MAVSEAKHLLKHLLINLLFVCICVEIYKSQLTRGEQKTLKESFLM